MWPICSEVMTGQTLAQIAAVLGAAGPSCPERMILSALTDSRSLVDPESTLFFALRTPNNDGHRYVADLLAAGVRAFVVERVPEGVDPSAADFLVVGDVLEALRTLAESHRRGCTSTTVIAVAGSRGKTMVKEGIYRLLADQAPSVRSPRSYNSQVGVALSLLEIDPQLHRFAVIEAGISRKGEMARLERMIRPDMVVVTNILQKEHSEGFVSVEEKRSEKLILARRAPSVIAPAGLGVGCGVEMPSGADVNMIDGILAAAAVRALGMPAVDAPLSPLKTRLDVTEGVNNCLVISDRFTCDIFSLVPALDFMRRRRTAGRTVTVMADDLGGDGRHTCRELARLLRQYGVERFIGIGRNYLENKDLLPAGSRLFASSEECLCSLSAADFSRELILVKGEPDSVVHSVAETLRARHHETVLEVNLDAVIHNFNQYRSMVGPGTGMVAMVKASGYGAGSYELAKTLQSQGAAYLAVAVVDEGEELRRAGITMPVMVMNPKVTDYNSLFANMLEPEIFSFDMLAEIIREGEKRGISGYPVHIKFDTGMHRLGFLPEDIPALGRMLRATSVVKVRSAFSHLATADCLDMDDYTLMQLHLYDDMCAALSAEIGNGFLRHILNSAGIARFPQWQYDLVRLGIGLYGVDTLGIPATSGLRTVSTLRSIIIAVKEWPAGTSIGYGRRTVLGRRSLVATVPVGYADGLNRRLGNGGGFMMVRGVRCPIVGNVCMDSCMVDVTEAGADVAAGEPVEIFGENIPVSDVAEAVGTIPYEILTSVSPRVKRVYYRE